MWTSRFARSQNEGCFNDFKFTLTSDEPDESLVLIPALIPAFAWGVRGHAPPGNFEFQKSKMAISCYLRGGGN